MKSFLTSCGFRLSCAL